MYFFGDRDDLAKVLMVLTLLCTFHWTVKRFLVPLIWSPFRYLPGPLSASWITGNLGQLFSAKGLPFHQELVDQFGGMVRIRGFLGVGVNLAARSVSDSRAV